MTGFEPNHWDIPTLDPSMQATPHLLGGLKTWLKWGEDSRSGDGTGKGLHLYTYDHNFSALLKHPGRVVLFNPTVAVEPNFSTFSGQPRALSLWTIYQKRRISQFWQGCDIPILVDLNVSRDVIDLAFLGVPLGWTAYATRAHHDTGHAGILDGYVHALKHADGAEPLFVVFGGGKRTKGLCDSRGWNWVPESRSVARDRHRARHRELAGLNDPPESSGPPSGNGNGWHEPTPGPEPPAATPGRPIVTPELLRIRELLAAW